MDRICLFPGTFDPVTLGHVDIINRALPLFDRIVVGIGMNTAKAPMFSAEQRLNWIREIYAGEKRVEGAVYEGLTIDFCRTIGAKFILRGIRLYGIPAGYEFGSLIEDVKLVSEGNSGLSPETRKMVARLTKPVRLQVFITPT